MYLLSAHGLKTCLSYEVNNSIDLVKFLVPHFKGLQIDKCIFTQKSLHTKIINVKIISQRNNFSFPHSNYISAVFRLGFDRFQ